MSKVYWLIFSLMLVSINSQAVEPMLDQQATFYFNLSFDVGQATKTGHDFGFRFDRSLIQPGDNMTMSQLTAKPAVLNLKLNKYGLEAFELNGIDYTTESFVYRAAEDGDAGNGAAKTAAKTGDGAEAEAQPAPETTGQPKRKIDVPLGVVIGVLIGAITLAQ